MLAVIRKPMLGSAQPRHRGKNWVGANSRRLGKRRRELSRQDVWLPPGATNGTTSLVALNEVESLRSRCA